MGRGTPVYYDMEAYHGHRRCKDATLAFLDAWTRTLHAHGYSSGVYSSASSGAENLGWAHRVNGHAIAKPDSMWFGLWDNEQNVRGLPYLLRSWWQGPRRIKQYEGPYRRSLGGYTAGHRLRLGLRGCLPVINPASGAALCCMALTWAYACIRPPQRPAEGATDPVSFRAVSARIVVIW